MRRVSYMSIAILKKSADNPAMITRSLLEPLDRKIVAALQVNARAGWRRIAAVLDAPERTVAAHGTELVRSRRVRPTYFTVLPQGGVLDGAIASVRCISGMNRVTATAAASRNNSVFTYLTTGEADCVFELMNERAQSLAMLLDEIPGMPGAAAIDTATILKLYKGTHQWLPGILEEAQVAALTDLEQRWEPTGAVELAPLSREEQAIARVLAADGRATIEELARATALSPASARRRLAHLQASGRVFDRAVVEPAALGFPVEAILRIRTFPGRTESVAMQLAGVPEVRYLAFTTGRHQLFVDIACVDHSALADFLTRADWTEDAVEVDTSIVIQAIKRSGVRMDDA
ncbi:Lrp/AsnC family transcriptional regulator [Leucobacter triazinivorans]|uniref:Lrp/AsnC family transcriptional regulator n=1 Tax=Leucobacter triazinivorans TaxID=1784719 RepID=A0A4P6KH16_9MICO|nr:Lrp/AsnC family transcriptional regulator [Leucobacter triazinivorans]QBE49298.1 Lrp/AsnC family transcriptional regulator [Leucobacter triazinivorans]